MSESHKIGRSKRAPSNANQKYRTKANKAKNIERVIEKKDIDRGARRRARRASVNWGEVNQRRHDNGKDSVRWQDYAQS